MADFYPKTELSLPLCRECYPGDTSSTSDSEHSGSLVSCESCGIILEDQPLISSVLFEKDASGKTFASGRNSHLDLDDPAWSKQSSEAETIRKNVDILRGIASVTKCDEAVIRDAAAIYKKAKKNLMSKGRKIELLLSACLYMGTRRAHMSHTILDFLLSSNSTIRELRDVVRYLTLHLCIEMPSQDPVWQVEPLCYQLIEDKRQFVQARDRAETIVQRMKMDWLDSGRKPAGVTAAAVVIACRIESIEIDLEKLINLAKVSIGTVKKRMLEFSRTESAQLVPAEFETCKFERARVHPAMVLRLATDTKSAEETLGSKDKKEAARCLKKLCQTIVAASENGVTGDPMEHSLESFRVLTTTLDIVTRKESMGREKSLIYGTQFTCDGRDESQDFEDGSTMIDQEFLNSMLCNKAEQEVRSQTNNKKFGTLLKKRADNKNAKPAPPTPVKQPSAVAKACANLTNKGTYKRKIGSSTKIDQNKYEAFLDAHKDDGDSLDMIEV